MWHTQQQHCIGVRTSILVRYIQAHHSYLFPEREGEREGERAILSIIRRAQATGFGFVFGNGGFSWPEEGPKKT